MLTETVDDRIRAFRESKPCFTRQIGVLLESQFHSPYSLTEARVLFELARCEDMTASAICRELGLDPGYLSRILARLEQLGAIEKIRSETDGRQRLLRLTQDGQSAFAVLDQRSREEVAELLGDLSEADQQRLLEAMQMIQCVLDT